MKSNEEYYREGRLIIFTEAFHLKRGYCCGAKCRHCPYEKPPVKGNIKLETMPKNHIQLDLKKALYLDDQRTPTTTIPGYEPWQVVRNYEEFVRHISEFGIPDLISFDHDLADEHIEDYYSQVAVNGFQYPTYEKYQEKTGLDCARWLAEYVQEKNAVLKSVCVHSHNPVGATNIQSYINGLKKHMGWEQDCYLGRHPYKLEKIN